MASSLLTALISIILSGVIFSVESQSECPSEKSRELYLNLCNSPRIAQNVDAKWVASHSSVWYIEIGNDVARLHYAEVIKGKLLNYDDDYSDMCGATKTLHSEGMADGHMFGFGNLTANWKCLYSRDDPGVVLCDLSTDLSKYKDKLKSYVTYTDNENVIVGIACFPNGEVGWTAASSEKVLPEKTRADVLEHVKSMGFDVDRTVTMFDDKKCPDREYL